MKIVAWIVLVLNGLAVLLVPFAFGKPRPPIDAGSYLMYLFGAALATAICGRVLGWW